VVYIYSEFGYELAERAISNAETAAEARQNLNSKRTSGYDDVFGDLFEPRAQTVSNEDKASYARTLGVLSASIDWMCSLYNASTGANVNPDSVFNRFHSVVYHVRPENQRERLENIIKSTFINSFDYVILNDSYGISSYDVDLMIDAAYSIYEALEELKNIPKYDGSLKRIWNEITLSDGQRSEYLMNQERIKEINMMVRDKTEFIMGNAEGIFSALKTRSKFMNSLINDMRHIFINKENFMPEGVSNEHKNDLGVGYTVEYFSILKSLP